MTETRYIVQHITKNPSCQKYVDKYQFKVQFTVYKKEKIRRDDVKRKQASRAKLRAEDNELVKEKQTEWKKTSRKS